MKGSGPAFPIFLLALAIIAVVALPAEAAFIPDRWQKYSSINQGDIAKGYAMVELTPEIYHAASRDLRDLRMVWMDNGQMKALPYDIVSYEETAVKKHSVTVINKGINNAKSTATVFLGESTGLHNNLEIQTADRDFIKQVTIEGSNDKTDWVKLDSSGTIADVSASGDDFRRTGVTYSPNDYRYLRITLTGDGNPVSIDSVYILYRSEKAKPERQLSVNIVSRKIIEKDRSESIILTSGFNNLKLQSLSFSVDSVNFSRDIVIFGSHDMKEWVFIGEGKLELLKLPRSKQQSLSVPVNSPGYRYLKVVIKNRDNPPLKISGVAAKFIPEYLLFPCEKGGSFRLYLSNPAAKAPEYDLVKLSSEIMTTQPPLWTVSQLQNNPVYKMEPEKVPESEKHKWLLPGILAVLVAVLAIVIIKSLPHITKNQ